ncbi:MAG TPA: hypothetical protein VHM19_02755 [Polyangiales bacterium]|nr:hypothetical protein [Polyangiales bacterium]
MDDGVKPQVSLCARHPDRRALGTCSRCGTYYCEQCHKRLSGRVLCGNCLEIPGIDYIRATRDRFWGKRDGWVWYFGIFSGLGGVIIGTVAAVQTHDWVTAATSFAALALVVPYFLLVPWARKTLFLLLVLYALRAAAAPSTASLPVGFRLGSAAVGILIAALFMLGAYTSTRNKLAFRIEVSDADLERLCMQRSNGMATRSLVYGFLSMFIPLTGLIVLPMAVSAYRRAKPDAWPPVGGKVHAIAGLIMSSLGVLLWSVAAYNLIHK